MAFRPLLAQVEPSSWETALVRPEPENFTPSNSDISPGATVLRPCGSGSQSALDYVLRHWGE